MTHYPSDNLFKSVNSIEFYRKPMYSIPHVFPSHRTRSFTIFITNLMYYWATTPNPPSSVAWLALATVATWTDHSHRPPKTTCDPSRILPHSPRRPRRPATGCARPCWSDAETAGWTRWKEAKKNQLKLLLKEQGFIYIFLSARQRAHFEWFLCDILKKLCDIGKSFATILNFLIFPFVQSD